ncbi:RnfABCDGE type electron transport complex subunit D [Candidatus Giovannonibacteria bacterium]|nr:RnfABCDGE type electron transport complex subunit D [Candidatus Giovannonibacteria bacterium]
MKINIKHFMVLYLAVLLVLGAIFHGNAAIFLNAIAIVLLYSFFDLIWTYFRDRIWYMPESSLISGLILSLVGPLAQDYRFIILLPLLAVFSKQIIKFNGRHIFNPAAFSLVVLSLFSPFVLTWWGANFAYFTTWIMLAGGIFILWRQRRFETAIAFLLTYMGLFAISNYFQKFSFENTVFLFRNIILDGTVLFFVTVMLIEPMTSSFRPTRNRVLYGIIVGAFAVIFAFKGPKQVDYLLLSLLVGNLIMRIIEENWRALV